MNPAQDHSPGSPTDSEKPEANMAPWYTPLAALWLFFVASVLIFHGIREVWQRVGSSVAGSVLNPSQAFAPIFWAFMLTALITVVTHVIAWFVIGYGPIYAIALLTSIFQVPKSQNVPTTPHSAKNRFVTFDCPHCGKTISIDHSPDQRVAKCLLCQTDLTDEAIDAAVEAYRARRGSR